MNSAMRNAARESVRTQSDARVDPDSYYLTADGRDTRAPIKAAYPVCSCLVLNHIAGPRGRRCPVHGDSPGGAAAEQADPSNACVRCGTAPWGHGYCAELCEKCAADDEAEDERLAEQQQCDAAAAAEVWG